MRRYGSQVNQEAMIHDREQKTDVPWGRKAHQGLMALAGLGNMACHLRRTIVVNAGGVGAGG